MSSDDAMTATAPDDTPTHRTEPQPPGQTKPTVGKTVARMMTGRASAEAPMIAILAVTCLRMVLEGALYQRWDVEIYPQIFAQQFTFYTFMFVGYAAMLKIATGLPFERVTNVASVGLLFGVLPPILHALFFPDDGSTTVYFRSMAWTLFEENQAIAESLTLWGLVAGSALFVALVTRSIWRTLFAFATSYGLIIALTALVIFARELTDGPEAGRLFGADVGLLVHRHLLIDLGQAGVAMLAFCLANARSLWGSVKRMNHALPHAALCLCGGAWVGADWGTIVPIIALVLVAFFVLLVQNDYFDRKEDALAGRKKGTSRGEMLWVTFLYVNVLSAVFMAAPFLALQLFSILLLGLIYHHPSIRLKSRFCFSYMVEGGWAALAFTLGASTVNGLVEGAEIASLVTWFFWGGALLSMPKDWKDFEADRAVGIWTIYVTVCTLTKRSFRSVHVAVSVAIAVGLTGFASIGVLNGLVRGPALTLLGAALFLVISLGSKEPKKAVEWIMFTYALALGGVALGYMDYGSPGAPLP